MTASEIVVFECPCCFIMLPLAEFPHSCAEKQNTVSQQIMDLMFRFAQFLRNAQREGSKITVLSVN